MIKALFVLTFSPGFPLTVRQKIFWRTVSGKPGEKVSTKSALIKNTYMPMDNGAIPVNHVSLRCAIDTQIQSNGALYIDNI